MPEREPIDPETATLPMIGSYRLVGSLAGGGMSAVHKAVHMQTGHEVAIKILPRALAKKATMLQRFLREAKTAEALQHPNIVSIYDRGFDQGRHYLVLEFIPGGDLHERVRSKGPLPVVEVIEIMRQVAEGLRYGMAMGVIHRDIKPANLLMTEKGLVKITDLGLVLTSEDEDERVTRDGTTVGTVDFMAPEQARDSRATSVRSDIYSLGCTAYYLLCGQAPYSGGTLTEKLRRHAKEKPADIRRLRPDVPLDLSLLLQRMMAKQPEDRYRDHDELLEAIAELGRPRSSAVLAVSGSGPLPTALFDDEDEDGATAGRPGSISGRAIPQALFDDEDRAASSGFAHDPDFDDGEGGGDDVVPVEGGLDIAALGELERRAEPTARPRAAARDLAIDSPAPIPLSGSAFAKTATLLDDRPQSFAVAGSPGVRRSSSSDSTKTWVLRGLGIGLCAVFVVLLASQLIAVMRGPSLEASAGNGAESVEANPDRAASNEGGGSIDSAPLAPSDTAVGKQSLPKTAAKAGSAPRGRPVVKAIPEPVIPLEVTRLYVPEWALKDESGQASTGPERTLRRLRTSGGGTAGSASSLRGALDAGGDLTIEDVGPFYIDDFRLSAGDRRIKAGRGVRPMIVISPSESSEVSARSAVITVPSHRLAFEGIDIVIDLGRFSPKQNALFLVKGGELDLSDCTLTFVGGVTPFSFCRAEQGAEKSTSRIKLSRTLVRGANLIGFEVAGGALEVSVQRSVMLCGPTVVSSVGGTTLGSTVEQDPVSISIARSVLAARDAIFALGGLATRRSPGEPRYHIRALASTFGKFEGAPSGFVIRALDELSTSAAPALDWLGSMNVYDGWPGWLGVSDRRPTLLATVEDMMEKWSGKEEKSRSEAKAWPASIGKDWAEVAAVASASSSTRPIIARVAGATPYLKEKTIGAFAQPSFDRSLIADPSPSQGGAARAGLVEATYQIATAGAGDFGEFLRKQAIPPGAKTLRVYVSGTPSGGESPRLTPVKMPKGVSLELIGEENAGVVFHAAETSSAEAALSVEGADLILKRIRITRAPTGGPKWLAKVSGGNLVVHECRFTSPAAGGPGGGDLISYRAEAGADANARNKPRCIISDSLLAAGGIALRIESARSNVFIENSALSGQAVAIDLSPIAHPRFDSEIVLEHCTISARDAMIRLGAWAKDAPLPGKPWLIHSHRSAYLDLADRDSRKSALVLTDPEAIRFGVYGWRTGGDAYEPGVYIRTADAEQALVGKPDLRANWLNVWGPVAVREATGPRPVGTHNAVRFLRAPLDAQGLPAHDLALDPTFHQGRAKLDVGANLKGAAGDAPTNRSSVRGGSGVRPLAPPKPGM